MKIREVEAVWLRVPLPAAKQHVSDFGRIEAFDGVLVTIRTENGLVGYGEAKAGVGSAGDCAGLTAILAREFAPRLIGADAREITRIGQSLSNGVRAPLAER
ncbi:MAG: mandelate racemase/muconate lactonizing enzyme family protein, partial [Planctomycetota bacterium]|nr:mandelate racemase/muconate lactonizing enzyme family protein [Planctomycetota bacterium]